MFHHFQCSNVSRDVQTSLYISPVESREVGREDRDRGRGMGAGQGEGTGLGGGGNPDRPAARSAWFSDCAWEGPPSPLGRRFGPDWGLSFLPQNEEKKPKWGRCFSGSSSSSSGVAGRQGPGQVPANNAGLSAMAQPGTSHLGSTKIGSE
jgi:hypothetical protein